MRDISCTAADKSILDGAQSESDVAKVELTFETLTLLAQKKHTSILVENIVRYSRAVKNELILRVLGSCIYALS